MFWNWCTPFPLQIFSPHAHHPANCVVVFWHHWDEYIFLNQPDVSDTIVYVSGPAGTDGSIIANTWWWSPLPVMFQGSLPNQSRLLHIKLHLFSSDLTHHTQFKTLFLLSSMEIRLHAQREDSYPKWSYYWFYFSPPENWKHVYICHWRHSNYKY